MKQWLLLLLFIVSNLPTKAQTIQFKTSPTTLKELMSLVEEQTSYSFAYSNNIQTNRALGAEAFPASMEVKQLLEKLNLQHAYKYEIIGNTITVKQAAQNNAQKNYTLSGTITDPANVPLLGANIYVEEAATGTSTDENGKFALELPEGTYTLNISYIGFMNQIQTVNLNQDITIKAQLEEDGESLEEVVITQNSKAVDIKKPQMSMNTLDMNEIKQIPVAMGEPDPLKSLLTLPGVTNAGEGSSGFNVRGGAADQNLILLDGTPIYSDSHMFGFFSVFNADVVNNLELYKGGIPSQFGGRVSSVLDVHQHTGSDQEFKATGGIGLISSKLMLEGPIEKEKGSFMIGGRTSYAHLFLQLADNENSAMFYDLNTRLKYRLNDKNVLSFSGYYGNDLFDINDSFSST